MSQQRVVLNISQQRKRPREIGSDVEEVTKASGNRVISCHPTDNQKAALIAFMQQHLDVARNQFSSATNGKWKKDRLYAELANLLNAMGGANKTDQQWKKCWDDIKGRVKVKSTKIRESFERSGINGTTKIPELDSFEESVLAIITSHAIDGDGANDDTGFFSTVQMNVIQDNDAFNLPESIDVETSSVSNAAAQSSIGQSSEIVRQPSIQQAKPSSAVRTGVRKPYKCIKPNQDANFEEKLLAIEEEKLQIMKNTLELKKKKCLVLEESNLIQRELLKVQTNILERLNNAISF